MTTAGYIRASDSNCTLNSPSTGIDELFSDGFIDFLFPPESQAAGAFQFASGVAAPVCCREMKCPEP